MSDDIKVEECGREETEYILRRLGLRKNEPAPGLLGELHGYVDAVCRNEDGSVAWEVHQPNIVTDAALRRYAYGWHYGNFMPYMCSMMIFLSPNTETPLSSRYCLPDDGTGISYNGSTGTGVPAAMNASWNGSTYTWTYSYTFSGASRQVGTIGLGSTFNSAWHYWGCTVWACTLLNPVKTQTPSQTVETVYRITLIPNY